MTHAWRPCCAETAAVSPRPASGLEPHPRGDLTTATIQDRLQQIAITLAGVTRRGSLPEIFGAAWHRFQLGPRLDEDAVSTFERRHDVVLPADYRAFITTVGIDGPGLYGGAGPFYGLMGLHNWAEALDGEAHDGALATPYPVHPDRTDGPFCYGTLDAGSDAVRYTGTLTLCHAGCGDMAVLVVTGPSRGRVAYTGTSPPLFARDPDFLSWYERWLDAALRGETSFW